MKNKITIILVLVVAVATMAFGSQSSLTETLFSLKAKAEVQPTSQIPSHILYDQMFRMIISFKRKTEEQQSKGEGTTPLSDYFKEKAQLNAQENEILQQVAIEFIQEVERIDKQAESLITQTREVYSANGVVSNDYLIPSPPELDQLQEQRNNLALNCRDRLSALLGSDKFAELDKFVQEDFASGFQSISVSSIPQQ